jgi:ABC-type nitrate/sulfonate/bicarbonate transport system substrate-binding protein
MTLSRRTVLHGLAAAAPLGLYACAATPPASSPAVPAAPVRTEPIQVISFGGGFNLPLWAARDHGFFTRHGIHVQLTITPDSRQLFSGMMEGKYHVAITAFDNILAYQENQGEVKFNPPSDFFAFMGSDDGFLSLVAAPEVKSFADLRGKTISVDSMSNGFSFALRDMLARNGLGKDDVQWALAGGTDRRFAALMEKKHAATMLRAPFDLQAKNRGFNQLATTREVIGPYMGIVGAARRSWARSNEAATVAFIRAYRDAIRWLKTPANRPAAVALLVRNVPNMSEQIALQSCDLMLHLRSGFFSDVQLDAKGVAAVLALRSKLAEPTRALNDPTKYLDEHFWRLAMRG